MRRSARLRPEKTLGSVLDDEDDGSLLNVLSPLPIT
jgi:hypothetical protein